MVIQGNETAANYVEGELQPTLLPYLGGHPLPHFQTMHAPILVVEL